MRISDWSSDVCSSDVKLTVDKVGDPSEEQPNGRGAGDQVAQGQDREASLSREQPSRADHAQQAAMERHAAAPDHEYLKRSEEHTSELQSLMRISYAVFCLKKKKKHKHNNIND